MDTAKNKQLPPESAHAPGRIVMDSRGRNVWQWSDDQLDSTTIMLQRLDNSTLALEPTRSVRRPAIEPEPSDARSRGTSAPRSRRSREAAGEPGGLKIEQSFKLKLGGGFDPYNNG